MRDDPSGSLRDFGTRKSTVSYDPYNEESDFTHLRYEDEVKLRASLVLNVQKRVLSDIVTHYDKLDYSDKERFTQVQILIERLDEIKIVDAPVLLKLYNLYRYKLAE